MPNRALGQVKKVTDRSLLWTAALFSFITMICLFKAVKFNYPNFIFNYPFISYDGFQWISDSLHYLDRNIDITHRNPALPILFAILRTTGLVDFYPFFIAFVTVSFFASAYWFLRAMFSPAITRLTVLWFFFVFRIHNFFDYILSDPWCLVLVTLGLGSLLRASKDVRYLVAAAASFGLALNFQFAPAFTAPALIWYVFRGVGPRQLLAHRAVLVRSVVVFLVLALPQFIYKWIAFGSPLYSHVIHFPLLRVHLFGLPFYAVNLFAFLGWPLACVMLWGVRKEFYSRSFEWQLIHLYSLCMFLFWIVCYLWLDVRFLLYLVPGWLMYCARGVQALNLVNWLSFRDKTPIHRFAIIVAVYFAVSLASFKVIAFESTILPITPQMSLRFSAAPISEWGVSTLTTDKITTEHADSYETLFNLASHFKFYRGFARASRAQSDEYINDVNQIAQIVDQETTSADRIGLVGDLWTVFEVKMRIFNTLARNLESCSSTSKLCVSRVKDFERESLTRVAAWRGAELIITKPNESGATEK